MSLCIYLRIYPCVYIYVYMHICVYIYILLCVRVYGHIHKPEEKYKAAERIIFMF